MNKDEIRIQMKSARRGMSETQKKEKSLAVQRAILSLAEYAEAGCIMLYSPIGSEVETAWIAERALADGKRVLYPVTDEASGKMTAVEVTNNSEFVRGGFGISEPRGEKYTGKIDLIIVPGVAFDREGTRLGFGKGCYDRFLADTNVIRVGVCYDLQLTDSLPTEKHDARMDMIVTENEIIRIKKNA